VSRTVAMSNKYFGGIVEDTGAAEPVDAELKNLVKGTYEKVEKKMEELRVAEALTEIFQIFKRSTKYIDETEPWVLAKDETKKDRLKTVLYNLTESISIGAALLYPFMPRSAEEIASAIGLTGGLREFDTLTTFGLYPNGNKVREGSAVLFARKDLKEVLERAAEITKKQKAEYEEAQRIAEENLKAAGRK
ncbi:MAG: class I tRNA ligase family protein, partial [Lachnospiraceae bacterium]|nr:class I tRNA ligase family protein [Lachnospiraceae bacterium]